VLNSKETPSSGSLSPLRPHPAKGGEPAALMEEGDADRNHSLGENSISRRHSPRRDACLRDCPAIRKLLNRPMEWQPVRIKISAQRGFKAHNLNLTDAKAPGKAGVGFKYQQIDQADQSS